MPRPTYDLQTVRIPFLGNPTNRDTVTSKDQRFLNVYFDILSSAENTKTYYMVKRPGYAALNQPPAGAAVGRGLYSWRGSLYSCFGTKLYKGTTDLGVTLSTSSGMVTFEPSHPAASTQYLAVNDGTSLYVITTSDTVIVLNNVAITSSSVANPTVITTSSAHGLTTGNQVIIRSHSGSTPSLNGTVYTVTVTGASTFTIPVNVTVGGTGGTLGVFPSTNSGDLILFDRYWFTIKSDGSVNQSDYDDPLSWDNTKVIYTNMYNGTGVGLGHQNNLLFAFTSNSIQAFYDAANASGSILDNVEQAAQQYGCASAYSIQHNEDGMFWVSNSESGGYQVLRLSGTTQLQPISTPGIERILRAEGSSISMAMGHFFRIGGHAFYLLSLSSSGRTLVYDLTAELWLEWTDTAGTAAFPITHFVQHSNTLVAQHTTNGYIYTLSESTYQDAGTNFPVIGRFKRLDLDDNRRKFAKRAELIGDIQSSTTNVSLQYSDDDYSNWSTARTLDMAQIRPRTGSPLGNFTRRAWQVTYTGANPLRLEALELQLRIGTY